MNSTYTKALADIQDVLTQVKDGLLEEIEGLIKINEILNRKGIIEDLEPMSD